MKTKLISLLLAFFGYVGTIAASVTIDNIAYNLNEVAFTAEVAMKYPNYSGNVVIPSSFEYNEVQYTVTSIGEYAFSMCTSLTSVTMSNSITTIGKSAFFKCTSLQSVVLSNSLISISESAFSNCTNLVSIEIPNSVVSIEKMAFSNCSKLDSISFGNKLSTIGEMAFYSCTAFSTFVVPNSVISIEKNAFSNCSNLTSVTIGHSANKFGEYVFNGCPLLTSITWNSVNCKDIGNQNPFNGIQSQIISFVIGDDVQHVSGHLCDGMLNLSFITIPHSVSSIGRQAFQYCTKLSNIIIPNSVAHIDTMAFYLCSALENITLSNSINSIAYSTFNGCRNLKSINIPDGVLCIEENAFLGCSQLTSITIPNTMFEIGKWAFYYCTALESIMCQAITPPICADDAFFSVDKTTPLYVPDGSEADYNEANEWKEFTNILPISESPTAFDHITNDQSQITNKVICNGQHLILRGNHTYTLTGQEIK